MRSKSKGREETLVLILGSVTNAMHGWFGPLARHRRSVVIACYTLRYEE